ncbi:hypothetical protein M9458_003759, partial [Cirrhinus mrigala]
HQRVHQKPTDEKGTDEAEMNEEMDGAKDSGEMLEGKEVQCSSESQSEATASIQSEKEHKAEAPQEEKSEGHVEEIEEKQHPGDTSVEMNSAEEPQPDGAEQDEHQTLVASVEAQSACDPEPAKISVHSCTAAQEMMETPV